MAFYNISVLPIFCKISLRKNVNCLNHFLLRNNNAFRCKSLVIVETSKVCSMWQKCQKRYSFCGFPVYNTIRLRSTITTDHPNISKACLTTEKPTPKFFFEILYHFSLVQTCVSCLIVRKMNPSPTPAQIIAQLENANDAHLNDIVNHAAESLESFGEGEGSYSLILDPIFDDGGSSSVRDMCNFTA